ncbi:MAG TPA: MarR family transcriptional regulator [Myxococcota bacterium]|nr:MarR family transcriptional regulator [Myxococcota bacterium]
MATKDKSSPSRLREALSALQRLADAFAQRRAQLAEAAGLSQAQWRVLEQIAEEDFMPSLFARQRARSAAAVSKVIRQLLDQGLIAVEIAEIDARQRRYSLTAAGRAAMETVRRDRERALERIWSDFEPGPLARFAEFATELAARMESHAREEEKRGREAPENRKARRSGPSSKTRREI